MIPSGDYDIKINLSDDNQAGAADSDWTLKVQVFKSLEYTIDESFDDDLQRTDYPEPNIKSISTFGEVRIVWNK